MVPRTLALEFLLQFTVWTSLSTASDAFCTCSIAMNIGNNFTGDIMNPCVGDICFLSEDVTLKVHSGDVMVFSAGEYYLTSVLNITNTKDITMRGSGDVTISHDYPYDFDSITEVTTIQCNSSSGGLNFSNISNLSLLNLRFIGCGNGANAAAIYLTNVTNFNMSGVTILYSNSTGLYGYAVIGENWITSSFFLGSTSGVILQNSSASISSSTFANCSRGIQFQNTLLEVSLCHFIDQEESGISSAADDGSLMASGSTLEVFESTFNNCTFGMKMTSEPMLNVSESTFNNCTYGMHLNLSNAGCYICTFTANKFGSMVVDSSFQIANSQYISNYVGIFALSSTTLLKNASFYGGTIHCARAVSSKLSVTGNTSFTNCRSYSYGGALYLSRSVVNFVAPANVTFSNNVAAQGGAVYVEPWIKLFTKENCFFQVNDSNGTLGNPGVHLYFYNNHGHRGGSALYADIRTCKLDDSGSLNYGLTAGPEFIFTNISSGISFDHNSTTRVISYEPIKVCICENGGIGSCLQTAQFTVYPGQRKTLPIASVDLYNQIVPSLVFLGNEQNVSIDYHIANLDFACYNYTIPRVATYGLSNTIIYMNTGAALSLQEGIQPVTTITLNKQPCPLGYILTSNGVCECTPFLKNKGINCEIDNVSFTKPLDALEVGWLGLKTIATNYTIMAYSTECPFEYCDETMISVRSSTFDDQCSFNRAGVMCGGCRENLSATFGEPECKPCSNNYATLLVAFAALGVALVAFHSLLDITVSSGTITGLVFYANVLNVDSSLFFPPYVTEHVYGKFLYVFISWMNLDFGFDACFFNSMDSYYKTWLQFAFTVYVMAIVGVVILAGRCCSRCAILRPSNVVAVLATLILLSFTRTMNTVVSIFQFTDLYDTNSSMNWRVWMYDGNIGFASSKHAPLLAIAVIASALFIVPYTIVMLFSPCLQKASHLKAFCWVNKLKPFIDCYQAPYKDEYRFWTGILLSTRIVLSVVAVTTKVDRTILLLATNLAILALLIVFLGLGAYKRWQLIALESFLYANLNILSGVLLFSDASRDEKKLNTMTVSIVVIIAGVGSAFICFVGIVIFHIYLRIRKMLHRPAKDVSVMVQIEMNELQLKSTLNNSDLREPLMHY